jgi:hypothetical protein
MGLNLKRRLHAPGDSVKISLWQLDSGIDLSIGATTGTNRVKSHNHPGAVSVDVKVENFYCNRTHRNQ